MRVPTIFWNCGAININAVKNYMERNKIVIDCPIFQFYTWKNGGNRLTYGVRFPAEELDNLKRKNNAVRFSCFVKLEKDEWIEIPEIYRPSIRKISLK